MIEEPDQIHQWAVIHLQQGRPSEALRLYRQILWNVAAPAFEYDRWLGGALEAYRVLGRQEEAGHVLVYLRRLAEAKALFSSVGSRVELARCGELEARDTEDAGRRASLLGEAAATYLAAGRPVHAALAYLRAGDDRLEDARRCWEDVLRALKARPYELALCHFNLALLARRQEDLPGSHRHESQSIRLLEEVADDFEASGERERAFDCYTMLLQIGRQSGSFENLAEGYVNCIRVLKEDNLKFHVLHYHEDFLQAAIDGEEYHAAAQMMREAAAYARRVGLGFERGYLRRSAETWLLAAAKNERTGGPVELSENALLASIDGFAALGSFSRVRECYLKLSALELSEKKRQRYAHLAERYVGQGPEQRSADEFPAYLRQPHTYPAIWELDLLEWEMGGRHAEVCAALVGDLRYADMIRRRALAILLLHLDARPAEGDPALLATVAERLGELQTFAALSPLERLMGHDDARVREGVMRATRHLYFKRTFSLVARGLADVREEVRAEALVAVEGLHFPAAFDALVRIYRRSEGDEQRRAALLSLGRIATVEAAAFLIEVVRQEPGPLREIAANLLAASTVEDLAPILRRHIDLETGAAKQLLERAERGPA